MSLIHLINKNLWLVRSIAQEYSWLPVELDDLCSYGYLGLLKAAERFKGSPKHFPAYAEKWVRGEILKGIDQELSFFSWPPPVSRALRDLHKFVERYEIANGLKPSLDIQKEFLEQLIEKNPRKFPKDAIRLILWWSNHSYVIFLESSDPDDPEES